ncbi:hypothetical protein Cgig2_021457 [Carnegiea gigantea]|uniref:Endonuclease/exonuclease/phosphatase domain-containing protein n=1 Tax=Carnegiea gigantea TaxID=171969 RepID=A0A9Q1GGA5_9CARY|nr:hypothetical protein Cgig2_021457 [Carnegiea gigantea]
MAKGETGKAKLCIKSGSTVGVCAIKLTSNAELGSAATIGSRGVATYVCREDFTISSAATSSMADLQGIAAYMTEAWCVLGDFNAILHTENRMGGTEVTNSEIRDFADCVFNCGLQEMRSTGLPQDQGTAMAQLKRFQDNLRPRLRQLNKNNYADLHKQKDEAKRCLEVIQ